MIFKIPFTFSDIEKLKKRSKYFASKIRYKRNSKLNETLESAGVNITREEYLGIVLRSFVINFILLFVISNTILIFFNIGNFYIFGFGIAILFSLFVCFSQIVYPSTFIARKQRELEKNLLPALQDIYVQLNSGIPLFNIMVNISDGDYGLLSQEFKKAVKKINAGEPEADALNYLGKINNSNYFRRTLWQISNGINSGSDMSAVIKDSIRALNEEILIQIQNYGNKLNPLIVVYMLIAVIIPALSVAFLTILSSLLNLPKNMTILIFITLFVFDIFMQIMFLGLVKSRRPSLL
ncbi:MAG: type II secretion system F family protein [Nanoarchaeota archaeon]|nr:type II secretion system F family protein [Nanoarchaeota archaeon]